MDLEIKTLNYYPIKVIKKTSVSLRVKDNIMLTSLQDKLRKWKI